MTQKFHEPFSPVILENDVPQDFIDIINKAGDEVLNSKTKSAKWDWSHKLVGKVYKEIQIPLADKDEIKYCQTFIKQSCLDYLNFIREHSRDYNWKKMTNTASTMKSGAAPTLENINLNQSWIVSQYKHEYNPWHTHSGDFSGVIYLKVPDDMENHFNQELKDHYPASGLIDFKFGEKADMRSDTWMVNPKVGKMLIFPSWLNHSVYPFYCEGERRSMSFNAFFFIPSEN